MKSKTKFDPKVIQQFFIDHTEKFVIGLVAALFLFFAYQSFTLEWIREEAGRTQDGHGRRPGPRSPAVRGTKKLEES